MYVVYGTCMHGPLTKLTLTLPVLLLATRLIDGIDVYWFFSYKPKTFGKVPKCLWDINSLDSRKVDMNYCLSII